METQRFNLTEPAYLVERFTTSDTVTITLHDLSDGSTETLDSNSCAEIGSTGLFRFELAQITTYPTSFTEYAYVMNNGAINKDGKVVLSDIADQANGANQVTLTIEDTDTDPIEGVEVQVWNSADTVLQSISTTNASGQVVVMLDDGSYKVKLFKSLVTFDVPEDLTVSGTTVDTYTGTIATITPGSGAGECEVSIFAASQRPTVPLSTLEGTATIVSLPAELSGIYYPNQKIKGTYDSINFRIFWILPRGATVAFKVDDLGIQTENAIPASASADYKDL